MADTKLIMGKDSTIPDYILDAFQKKNEKDQPDGYTSLDSAGKVPLSLLPPVEVAGHHLAAGLALKEDKAKKGAADGYAPLDSSSRVPLANLPVVLQTPDANKQDISEKGSANGYAPLNSIARIDPQYLPPSSARPTHVFTTQQDMIAQGIGMHAGDTAVVYHDLITANNGSYMVLKDDPTHLADFTHEGAHVIVHRHNASDVDMQVLGHKSILQVEEDTKYSPVLIASGTHYTAEMLRAMHIDHQMGMPTSLINMNPDASGSPDFVPVSDLSPVGIEHSGLHLVNAILVRTEATVWRVIAEEWTGTEHQMTVEWVLDLSPDIADVTVIGLVDASAFTAMTFALDREIGDISALGSETLVHKLFGLENSIHDSMGRLSLLELAGVAANLQGVVSHAHVIASADFSLECTPMGGNVTFLMVNDDPTDHVGVDLWDGAEHRVSLTWPAGYKTAAWYTGWLTGTKPMTWISSTHPAHFAHLVDTLTGIPVTFQSIDHWIDGRSVLTMKWDDASSTMKLLHVEHNTAATLGGGSTGAHDTPVLPDRQLTVGDLRALAIGATNLFPTADEETAPSSGINVGIAKTEIIGVQHHGHRYINAVMLRTGIQTWAVVGQEYTGANKQQTLLWNLDLDPAWADHDSIGDIGARSFTSITNDIIAEIGDATQFGAMTIVEKILRNEEARHDLSVRVATLEGGDSHGHVDIVQEFHLWANNQGPHYLILNDRPTDTDHIGKILTDGNEHKIAIKWDEASPHSDVTPFDPEHFEDPVGSGNYLSWSVGQKPAVWFMHGSAFKQMVDPTNGAIIPYATVKSFIESGSILTVKWNIADLRLELLKVQAPTVHVVSTPDHQALQVGGQVDAKSLPFVSLNAEQLTHVKVNSLWLNESQKLMYKDNSGSSSEVMDKPTMFQLAPIVDELSVTNNTLWLDQHDVLKWRDAAGADHTVNLTGH